MGVRCLISMFVSTLLAHMAPAQDLDDLNTLVPDSFAAMKAEHWDEALKLLSKATAMKPTEALRSYGPQYGVVWYRRGVCEMKLHRWEEAIQSFETCYRDYPNRGAAGGNLYQTKALLKWGEAAVGAKNWDLAISRFRKFLDERDKARDTFPQGAFYVTLGICHYKLANIPEGNEQLEIAIRNKENFPTTEDQIVAGIQALVGAAIATGNEPALLDFLSSNGKALEFPPYRAQRHTAVFLKLASDAAAVKMNRAALRLFQLVVEPGSAIEDFQSRLRSASGPDRAALEAGLKSLEESEHGEAPIGLLKLSGLASVHEAMGELQTACELRERIEEGFPEAGTRLENLDRLTELRLRLAESKVQGGKPDEAITIYEKAWMEGAVIPGPAARAAKRWMELLWERNHEGDRLSACRGGLSFLEMTKDGELALTEGDRAARNEVAELTKAMQAGLATKPKEGS